MLDLHPEIIRKGGKEFVVLPSEEFRLIQEKLDDAEDLMELRKAKEREGRAPTQTLDQVKKTLGL